MNTATVMLKTGQPSRDVDDFPAGALRSTKGSLTLLPGVARTITQDELQHLNKLGIQVHTLSTQKSPDVQQQAVTAKTLEEVKAEVAAKKSAPK